MRRYSRWAAFLLAAGAAMPLLAADKPTDQKTDKKPDSRKTEAAKHVNTDKSLKAGQLTGKIVSVIESKKALRLQISLQYSQINPGAVQSMQQANLQLMQARLNHDLNGMLAAQSSLMQNQANMYTLKTITQDVELQTIDDVVVRLANPPPQFDDRGKVRKPTAKELRELRGDPKLPGYRGAFSDLAVEQVVTVTLVKKKGDVPRPRPRGKDADSVPNLENLPQVSMIYVIADPGAGGR
jgi:hypothetical protein